MYQCAKYCMILFFILREMLSCWLVSGGMINVFCSLLPGFDPLGLRRVWNNLREYSVYLNFNFKFQDFVFDLNGSFCFMLCLLWLGSHDSRLSHPKIQPCPISSREQLNGQKTVCFNKLSQTRATPRG